MENTIYKRKAPQWEAKVLADYADIFMDDFENKIYFTPRISGKTPSILPICRRHIHGLE